MTVEAGSRLKVLRAILETIREMAKDPACKGMDGGELVAELVRRLKGKLAEFDLDQLIEIIEQLLPLILLLIQLFFGV